MRAIILTIFACTSLFAQISDLATTDDGAQLYFVSPLRVKGDDENYDPKILRYVGKFERFREQTFVPNATPWRTGYYKLLAPQVSGGGTIVAWTSEATCDAGVDCFNSEPLDQSNIAGAAIALTQDYGGIRLGGDGRYALYNYSAPDSTAFLNVTTGAVTPLFPLTPIGDGRQAFTDSGQVLLTSNSSSQGVLLWNSASPATPVSLHTSLDPLFARISRNGSKLVYEATSGAGRVLIAFDMASGVETTLATGTTLNSLFSVSYFTPAISNDGSKVTFLSADSNGMRQVFLTQTTGGGQQLTREPAGISEAVLSGYGNIVYAVTTRSSLLQISLPSGAITRLAVPPVALSLSPTAAGSSTQVNGSGLSATTGVLVNDEPAPLLSVSDSVIVFQMPWDVRTDIPAAVRLVDNSPSPLEAGLLTKASGPREPYPAPMPVVNGNLLLSIHQDLMSLITSSSPARAGEIVTLYATGLGPVTGSTQTGVAAPTNGTLQFLTSSMICGIAGANAPVFFAGLAPGLIGLYQVNLQIPALPAGANPSSTNLSCTLTSGGTLVGSLFAPFPAAN